MRMKLSILERALLPKLMPAQENAFTLRIIQKFKKDVGFTAEELKLIEFKETGENVVWNPSKDPMKEVEVGELVQELIRKKLEETEKAKQLTEELLPLYERFVEKKV